MGDIICLASTISEERAEAAEDLVDMLEQLLVRAKGGELLGLAYAACGDNFTGSGWSGFSCRNDLSLAITLLTTRYHNACLE